MEPSFALGLTIFMISSRLALGQNLTQDVEFIRIAYNESLTRFDALFKCKDELEGSFASSYYFNPKTIDWIYQQVNSSEQELSFHRDLFNDTSFLNFSIWRTFDGFPFNGSTIDFYFENRLENRTIEVTYSSFVEWEDKKMGFYICESTPCGIGNWIYLNRNCYHLGPKHFNQAYTWSQSRNYCRAVGADLLVLSDERELQLIKQLIEPFNPEVYVYIGYFYSQKTNNWEWINNFQSNMKNFYESERKAQANVPSRNVSALYKMANSTNITLKLIPDTYEMIDSIDFSSLLGFVCKKKITACEAVPVINFTTFKIVSNFLEPDYLIYDCVPGFQLVRGDRTRLCNLNGKWRGRDIECAKKECGKPNLTEHAYTIHETINSPEKPYLFQDLIVHSCKKGFRPMNGNSLRTCNESSLWSGQALKCEKVRCKNLTAPQNARVIFNESTAQYECLNGYELFYGNSIRYCDVNSAQWSGLEPSCEKVFKCPSDYFNYGTFCLRFFDLNSSVSTLTYRDASAFCASFGLDLFFSSATYDLRFESAAKYSLQLVYVNSSMLSNETRLLCFDLRFSFPKIIECEKPFTLVCFKKRPTECSLSYILELINNSSGMVANLTERGFFGPDREVQIACREGYSSNSVHFSTIKCQTSGTWSENLLKCQKITCPESALVMKNGFAFGAGNTFGSKRVCFCKEGFYFVNSTTGAWQDFLVVTCTSLGKWSEQIPACLERTCERPLVNLRISPLIVTSALIDVNQPVGSWIEFKCRTGYKLKEGDLARAKCLPNGNWSSDLPTCEKIKCQDLFIWDNTKSSAVPETRFEYLDVIEHKCDKGLHICEKSHSEISANYTCIGEDAWAPNLASCCKIQCDLEPTDDFNIEYSSEKFFPNDQINFYCVEKHKLFNGSLSAKCLNDGTWNSPIPQCDEFTCENNLGLSSNAIMVNFSNELYEKAQFKCEENSRLISGNLNRYCTPIGWSGKPAFCQEANCQAPEKIEHGLIINLKKLYTVNSSISYACMSGYALSHGSNTRICQANSTWSGVAPTCLQIQCPYLKKPENCDLIQNGSNLHSIAEYRCHYGFKFKGVIRSVFRRICLANSSWSHVEPSCEMVRCPDLSHSLILNGLISTECSTYSCRAYYKCAPSYYLIIGDQVRLCGINGKWSGEEAICREKEILCPLPNQTPHSIYELNALTVGSIAHYQCQLGFFVASGNLTRTCLPNETWSGTVPVCNPKVCGPAPEIANSVRHIISNPFPDFENSFGTFVSYMCKPGYTMVSGKNVKTCNENGTWLGPDLVCKVKSNVSSIEQMDYDKKKTMSKAFGTIAISFIVFIYGTLIIIDINWKLIFSLLVIGSKQIYFYFIKEN